MKYSKVEASLYDLQDSVDWMELSRIRTGNGILSSLLEVLLSVEKVWNYCRERIVGGASDAYGEVEQRHCQQVK